MNSEPEAISFITQAMCGESRTVDFDNEHWFIVCTQTPDHEGPHVGLVSWAITEAPDEQ